MLLDQDNGKKKPTENYEYVDFQLVWFYLVACFLLWWLVSNATCWTTQQWEDVPDVGLLNSYEALQELGWPRVRPRHLWSPFVWAKWCCQRWRPDQTGGVTARGSRLNLERTILAWWRIWWIDFCHIRGNGLQPSALWSIRAFSHGFFFTCTCTCFIFCFVLFPSPFVNVSFTTFTDFPGSFWHFCFGVVWIVPVLCLKSWVSVSKLSLSPLHVLSFDLVEFH